MERDRRRDTIGQTSTRLFGMDLSTQEGIPDDSLYHSTTQ